MRQFIDSFNPGATSARVAYRVVRPGAHPSLDGVWWPRSYDLGAELPALIAALDSRGFRTEWVSFNQKTWGAAARRLRVVGRIIRLGRFRSIDPNMVSLSGHDGRARIDFLVVPPGSHPAEAERAFARVLDWDNRATASVALAAAEFAPAA